MDDSNAHPSGAQLLAFLQGQVDENELGSVSTHLELCPACCQRLSELSSSDPVLGWFRQAADSESSSPSQSPTTTLPSSPPPSHPAHPARLGDYEIIAEVGRGGMGVVYKARQRGLQRLVAVKTILAHEHASVEQRARFQREAELAAQVRHPNVVQVYQVGSHNDRPFIAMEWVEGGTLAKRLAGHPLPPREAAALVETLSRAVHAAHGQGVLHRDLKPANVLLSSAGHGHGEPPAPKVADFGLARPLDDSAGLTRTGALLGTPEYMAPEQASGPAGPAADIYGLGAILYETLTGAPPFRAATPMETLHQVRSQEPVPPSRRQAEVPSDLETVCLKCLEKTPSRRYASAWALADDLRRYLDGRPVLARPVGRRERLAKWARRHPSLAALLGVLVLLAVVGLPGVTLLWLDAASARRAAEANAASEGAARATADAALEESRKRLVRLYQATGYRHADAGEPWLALLWHAHAWARDRDDPSREADHRLRLAGILAGCPLLDGVCFHDSDVEQAEYDPAGRRVLTRTGGAGSACYLWDPARSQELTPPLRHDGEVLHAAFSPDGNAVATAGADNTARLWDAAGQPRFPPLRHPAPVNWAAFRPDGKQLATACHDGQIRLWDVNDGRQLGGFLASPNSVQFVTFSPEGGWLLTQHQTGEVKLWRDVEGQRPQSSSLPHDKTSAPPRRPRPQPSFSPDGRWVATTTAGRLWLQGLGRDEGSKSVGLGGERPACAVFSLQGDRVLAYGRNTIAKVVPVAGGRAVPLGHPREVVCGCFSPDGSRVATASTGGLVHVWDSVSGSQVIPPMRHCGQVLSLRFSPDGRHLLVAGRDGTARTWRMDGSPAAAPAYDFDCGSAHRFRNVVTQGTAETVSHSPCGDRQLRFGATPGVRVVWRRTGEPAGPTLAADEVALGAFFSADGLRVVTRGPGRVRVWDAGTGEPIGPPVPASPRLWQVFATRDAARLCTLDEGGPIGVHDVVRGRTLLRLTRNGGAADPASGREPSRTLSVTGKILAELSPDGSRLVTADAGLRVFDVDRGEPVQGIPRSGSLTSVDFSRDGRRMAFAQSDTTAHTWWVDRPAPAGVPLRHPTFVRNVALGPDGKRVATYCADGLTRLWNADNGELLLTLRAPPEQRRLPGAGLARLWFSVDGRRLVGMMPRGAPLRWPLPEFPTRLDLTTELVRLLTGQWIDQTEGVSFLPPRTLIEGRDRYRQAWLSWRGLAD